MGGRRGRSNKNERGNTQQRAKRRQFLLDEYGDGEKVQCFHCPTMLTFFTVTADRIIPGVAGGKYTNNNIRPSCMPCASAQGGKIAHQIKRSKSVKKGDTLEWMGCTLQAKRVAKDGTWADFQVTRETSSGAYWSVSTWSKRMSLPLSEALPVSSPIG